MRTNSRDAVADDCHFLENDSGIQAAPSANGHAETATANSANARRLVDDDGEAAPNRKRKNLKPVNRPNLALTNVEVFQDKRNDLIKPLPMAAILRLLKAKTNDWPRQVAGSVFVHDKYGVCWLASPAALFGWVAGWGQVDWRRLSSCVSKEEFFAELRRTATSYIAVETLPHEPKIAAHYYACKDVPAGDGKAVEKLLDFFRFQTPLDRQLYKAAIVTPTWGGPAGARPVALITASGRGKGKSKAAQCIGRLYGGIIDISANEDISIIKQRFLSPEANGKRVVTLDNVKTMRFSSAEVEGLITTDIISGKELYKGESRRPNNLSWTITLNGANLSTDMATRTYEIRLGEPPYDDGWDERVAQFIDARRQDLIADCIGFLRGPTKPLSRHTRWATWESQVLARLDDPEECLRLIIERRGVADVEREEGEIIEDYVAGKLRGLGYEPERDDVFIPNQVMARWYIAATGDNSKKTTGVSRTIRQLHDEHRVLRILEAREPGTGARGFRWVGEHADATDPVQTTLTKRIAEQLASRQSVTD